jgi:probable HAF family extracellular repeat protein
MRFFFQHWQARRRKPVATRLHVERLEDRCCPSSYTVTDLGTLGGAGADSFAYAINSAGQVVGESSNGSAVDAFLWTKTGTDGVPGNRKMKDLGTVGGTSGDPGLPSSEGNGINTAGQVVGEAYTASGAYHAFLWTNGGTDGVPSNLQMKDLRTLGGSNSIAYGINDATSVQVVGVSDTAGGQRHAFLWQNGVMTDLGTLGGSNSIARAINASGHVAGESYDKTGNFTHGFRWVPTSPNGTTGKMTDLGVLKLGVTDKASAAYGIDVYGDAVGWSGEDFFISSRAVYWTANGSIRDLNDLIPPNPPGFSTLKNATGINDGGLIVGWGYSLASSKTTGEIDHAFLLTPSTGQAPIPAASPSLGNRGIRPADLGGRTLRLADENGQGANGQAAFNDAGEWSSILDATLLAAFLTKETR